MEIGRRGRPSTDSVDSCGVNSEKKAVGKGTATSSTRVNRHDTTTAVEGQPDGSARSDTAVDMMSVCAVR